MKIATEYLLYFAYDSSSAVYVNFSELSTIKLIL